MNKSTIGKKFLNVSKKIIDNTTNDIKTIKNIYQNKQKMNFKDFKSLEAIERILNEASKTLKNKSITINNNKISNSLKIALSASPGVAISYGALYGLGVTGVSAAGLSSGLATAGSIIGGGMAAGVFVLAAPIVGTTLYGYSKVYKSNNEKLTKEIERLYSITTEKLAELNALIKEEANANKERIEYLTSLNYLLLRIIKDLKHDIDFLSGNDNIRSL